MMLFITENDATQAETDASEMTLPIGGQRKKVASEKALTFSV